MLFLTAEWRRLAIVSFAVPDDVLAPHLPPGIEPDRWEGSAVASVVAFEFLDTSLLGIPVYGFRSFPEWNLRFYVKEPKTGRRGVSFVKELVPGFFCSKIARLVYNEPYDQVPYAFERHAVGANESMNHVVTVGGRDHRLGFIAGGELYTPKDDTLAHFLKEQEWGYGTTHGGRRACYRVTHPVWRVYPETRFDVDADFQLLYGPAWEFLNVATPISKMVAEGSALSLYTRVIE